MAVYVGCKLKFNAHGHDIEAMLDYGRTKGYYYFKVNGHDILAEGCMIADYSPPDDTGKERTGMGYAELDYPFLKLSPSADHVPGTDVVPVVSFTRTWKSANDLPKKSGRYWCIAEEENELGTSRFQWNCGYHRGENRWYDDNKTYHVIFWTELAPDPG